MGRLIELLPHQQALLGHRIETLNGLVAEAQADLGRLALMNSGQLQFNFNTLEDTDPRSIALEGEW